MVATLGKFVTLHARWRRYSCVPIVVAVLGLISLQFLRGTTEFDTAKPTTGSAGISSRASTLNSIRPEPRPHKRRDRFATDVMSVKPERPLRTQASTPPARLQRTHKPNADMVQRAFPPASETTTWETSLSELWEIDDESDIETAEQLSEVEALLQSLIAAGTEGLVEIEAYLLEGRDVSFPDRARDRQLLAYPSLRLSLFDALRRIGGDEAENVLFGQLIATTNATEIATLARILHETAADEYREDAVLAATGALALANNLELTAQEVGSLFQVAQDYGDGAVVPELERQLDKWGYQSMIALAGLEGGAGIPTLIELADSALRQSPGSTINASEIYVRKELFALQMLAQVSHEHAGAYELLLARTRSGQIPDSLWPKIAVSLAGGYQFRNEIPADADEVVLAGVTSSARKSFPHVILRSGIIYIDNRFGADPLSVEANTTRLALIDGLISASRSPEAVRALKTGRSLLTK